MTEYVSHWGTRPSRLALLALLVGTYLPSGAAALSSCPTVPPKLRGGRLVVSLRSEPKTLNPVIALDAASRTVIERMSGDLLHIARDTQQVVPALAESWTVSRGGTRYTLKLRKNVLFSDGQPFTADDVLFSFQVYLDPKIHSPQRDLLVIGGVPMAVRKIDSHTVQFDLSQPYAAGERLFDTVTMLPRHLLKQPYEEGKLTDAWGLQTASKAIAGLGPFTLRSYVPGQQMVLSRNPYYWGSGACGEKLPHLDELVFLFAGSEAGQVMRFQAGEADVVSRIGADNYSLLEREADARGYRLHDLGPGMEYHFLLFNLNHVRGTNPAVEAKQKWFRDIAFRRAVSMAADRQSIVRLVFRGRAAITAAHVTPGNARWLNRKLVIPKRSVAEARSTLAAAGYSWRGDGALLDRDRASVEFTILVSAGNPQRLQIATIIQSDLKELGMRVKIATLESRAAMDRVFRTFDYDMAVMALAGGDADPNAEMNVWSLGGSTHLWNLTPAKEAAAWEKEIDSLMQQQLVTVNQEKRKRDYDRVQELVSEYLPIICLASPHVLVGAKKNLGNFRPAILNDYVMWNAEEIYIRQER